MIERVRSLITRHSELEGLMAEADVAANPQKMEELGREYRQIDRNLADFQSFLDLNKRIQEARYLLKNESDSELLSMAGDELDTLLAQMPAYEHKIKMLLLPKNPDDYKNAIMEIRGGTGGVEAGLFAGDLYRMYTSYAEKKGWQCEVISFSPGELDGVKEVIFVIQGENAFGTFKFESGVHRVQRIPQTESQGRIHTSAASVVVFPEADDVEVNINPGDLRIDTFRSSGPGGQNVNKTDSAIRIVHIPTGMIVSCQDEKSQHKNRAKALKVLQSRLYDLACEQREATDSASRRSAISSGDRSAKIRTYNFHQGRVTDHRINLTLYSLPAVINGDLEELFNALAIADINERLRQDRTQGESR